MMGGAVMKAVVYPECGAAGGLRYADVERPGAGHGSVLVRVRATRRASSS
jgi:NADPH:quinone reductase-like Zn-dependent oxidoreductase